MPLKSSTTAVTSLGSYPPIARAAELLDPHPVVCLVVFKVPLVVQEVPSYFSVAFV